MLTYEEGLHQVLDHARPLPTEKVALAEAGGRVLAQRARARLHMPRCDQSAMDGYAVRVADVRGAGPDNPVALPIKGEVRAGGKGMQSLGAGCAVRIFTGSCLPPGTEAVIMQEYCRRDGDTVHVERAAEAGQHIRRRGEEYRRGDQLLPVGACLRPPAIGLLATFGYAEVTVHRRPRVALVTMGDELVPVGERLGNGQIYNSNAFALAAALAEVGVELVASYTVADDRDVLRDTLVASLAECDVLVTAGGAAEGKYDFMRDVAASLGIHETFESLAVKPGKPTFFGTWRPPASLSSRTRRLVFGLPGNPVSALVSFHQLVKPALLRMAGAPASRQPIVHAQLTENCRKKPGRLTWLRGMLVRDERSGAPTVRPVGNQGSHMLSGLAEANCLIHFPQEAAELNSGQQVEVLRLSWDVC